VATPQKIAITVGLHEVSGLRWPKEPLTGDGPREKVAVPLPRLPWSTAAIEVPLGRSAAGGIARVLTLRRIFGYGAAPLVIVFFVIADVLLLAGRFGSFRPSGGIFLVLGVGGVLLILSGFLPDVVARATGTPYVTRHKLRFPAARADVARQLAKMNPQVEIGGLPVGDLQSPR
jgi:hypothetical protein